MATPLEKAKKALDQARPNEGDTIKVTDIPDGGMRIEIVIHKHKDEQNKWARFADEMHTESPLKGKSTLVTDHIRGFREGFSFEEE